MLNNRYSRGARFIAAKLETEGEVRINVSTPAADSYFFRVALYLEHYFKITDIVYTTNGMAIVQKRN